MSHSYNSPSPMDSWQEFVAWDEESNPLFSGDTPSNALSESFYLGGSTTSEQPYLVSAPPSVIDGPPSIGYTVSGPPSIIDGQSSFGQAYHTSLSFDTTATSPLLTQDSDQFCGSFGACDTTFSPLGCISESPILDTRYDRIVDSLRSPSSSFESTTDTVFNPHVANSSHAFSNLDVRVSHAFSNVGTWVDQPQIVEPIAECDEGRSEIAPIRIPHLQTACDSDPSYMDTDGIKSQHGRSRAITIPTRGVSYNFGASHTHSAHRVPPMLSVSPVSHRRPRGVSLSRSASQTRRKILSPSPTESLSWVSYQPNPVTNKLAPMSAEGSQGRTPRGRKKGLTAEQRSNAALMRIIGACSNCQRRKEKCDAGTPCRSCLEHYKGDLVNHPCRNRLLSELSHSFLSDRLGWHPTVRSLDSFITPGGYNIDSDITYTIPVNFGFGPALPVSVHALHINAPEALEHEHLIYTWSAVSAPPITELHAVLPAVITTDGCRSLPQVLDSHLSLLVMHHFRAFPLYRSDLQILRDVYIFSRSLSTSSPHYRPLHQALKLLVLVHDGGDITLPPRSGSHTLAQLVNNSMSISDDVEPTPCFIRSQFGAVIPGLALSLLKDILESLEKLLLVRDCDDWPAALAIIITVLMTVESIHYHAAKLPYHYNYGPSLHPSEQEHLSYDDEGVRILLDFYKACFLGCHARLRPDWEGEATSSSYSPRNRSPEDAFVESVRTAIRKATSTRYLSRKAEEKKRDDGDMSFFFDRLVARLLLLKS